MILLNTGCSTKLQTFDSSANATKGIPVPTPLLVKVTTTTSFKAIPGTTKAEAKICDSSEVVESYDYISSGDFYYVNFDPSQFADGSFEINFNDKGLASKISVNSEASSGVSAANSMLETLLPFYKVPKADKLAAKKDDGSTSARIAQASKTSAADLKAEHCVVDKKAIALSNITVN